MNIKILGSGCKNCDTTYKHVKEALEEQGTQAEIEKVTDFKDIMKYGVMKTPAVVINEKVVVAGRVVSKEEFKTIIQKL